MSADEPNAERNRLLVESTFEGIAIHEGGRIVAVNESLSRMFGYLPSELEGLSALELAAPPSRDLVRAHIQSGDEQPYEALGLRKDGSTFVGELRGKSATYQGRPVRVTAVRDISERAHAQHALAEAEMRLRAVIEGAPLVLFAVDAGGVFTVAEGKGMRVQGGRPDGLVGRSLFELYADEPEVIDHVRRAIAGEEHVAEVPLRRLGLVWEASYAPLRDADGRPAGAIGVAFNITGRKRVEAERDRLLAEEQVARASAEEALRVREEFLSIASHELNTPLTALKLRLQDMARLPASALPPTVVTGLEICNRQVNRLARLVADLLDVSRIRSGRLTIHREPTDLGELVRELTSRLAGDPTRSTIALTVHGVTLGNWDRLRLEQVVSNLLSNAIKYGHGTPITVRVDGSAAETRLTVSDRGPGIDADAQARIFERYERNVPPRRYGGLGLGLYIVRQIVEAHGGTIRLDSELGRGSTFIVELPLA